ncbi:MAG: GldL-related protein [Crocinitomicaceae bacterium]|jgi:hypothetical protein
MQNGERGFFSSRKGILIVNYFFYSTIILWILGISFKNQNWPGQDVISILSFDFMAMIVCIMTFASSESNSLGLSSMQSKIFNQIDHFSLAILIIGYLFKIMHWPGSDGLIIISLMSLALSAVIKAFIMMKQGLPTNKTDKTFLNSSKTLKLLGFIFFMSMSIVIISSLFWIIHFPGSDIMNPLGIGMLILIILVYLIVKSNSNVQLITISSRYALILLMFISSIWVYEDSKKMRLVKQELIYGLTIHDKIEKEVSRGDRIMNSTDANEIDKIKCMNAVNVESIEMIRNIETVKLLLLEKSSEETKRVHKGEFSCLFWSKYDDKNPLIPAQLNYYGLISRNNYDVPMHTLGVRGFDQIDVNGLGIKKLWAPYVAYQNHLIELCGTYSNNGENYSLKLNTETSISDEEVLLKTLNKSKINKADLFVLANLYSDLAFPEYDNPWMHFNESEGEPKLHWLTKNFDHTPMLKCLAILSDMELSIIKARTNAFAMISRR